ncbi:MAG: acylphosphatase [Bacteroidia bacterium]|jgi:acylphosphatase
MKHWHIWVKGTVQGVNFRNYTRKKALELGINGRVMNHPDGTVHVLAEGSEEQLNQLVNYCRQGPPLSRVSAVNWEEAEVKGMSGFEIDYMR